VATAPESEILGADPFYQKWFDNLVPSQQTSWWGDWSEQVLQVIMKSETKLLSLAIKSVSFGLVFWNSSGLLVSIGVGIRSEDPTLLHDAVERLYWQLLRYLS